VNQAPANDESAAAQAARELSRLQEETAQARAVLASVQRDLAEARKRLGSAQANQLLEANEQLVLALLRARTEAETAAQALDKVSRPAQFDSLSDLPNPILPSDRFAPAELQEANEQLVLAALSAQQLLAAAEVARLQQTELLALVAHELRNPLTPIRTAAALMGRVKSEELPRVQAMIERQVAHMARLVSDLLDISRVNTGKLRIEPRLVEMAKVIDEAIDSCRPAMDMRLQHFRVAVPSCALEVHGDPVRLAQVVSNLLDNASKYTPNEGDIKLLVEVVGETIVMTVSDSGIGITAEALPNVFDPFMQDPRAIGFNGIGLGIGLTVARELVEAHGGTVVATSAGSGLGSIFTVTLPLVSRTSGIDESA